MTVLVTYGAQKMFRKGGREGGREGQNDIYFGEIIMLNLIVLKPEMQMSLKLISTQKPV